MKILPPAKINLHLRVGPLAADGFHPILSWMCTTGLHDVLEMEAAGEPGVRLTCDRADVPVDEKNLIVRAGKLIAPERGAAVRLEKRIPMGGGLGGGSSNAAFALTGFNEIWGLNLDENQLAELAAKLGSDVPFFLHGPSSVCAGRGERVKPISQPRAKFVVLVFPNYSISTPAVYRRFDEMGLGHAEAIEDHVDWQAWTNWPTDRLLSALVNDLEPPTFSLCPQLAELRKQIEAKIGRTVRMSGSGSTLFTLADDRAEGENLAEMIRGLGVNAQCFDL